MGPACLPPGATPVVTIKPGDIQSIRSLWQQDIDHLRNKMETVKFISLDGWLIDVRRGLVDEIARLDEIDPAVLVDPFIRLFAFDLSGSLTLDPGPVTPTTSFVTHNTGPDIFQVADEGAITILRDGTIDITTEATVGIEEDDVSGGEYECRLVLETDLNDGNGWIEAPGTCRFMGAGLVP
jgi:hypothetical protein